METIATATTPAIVGHHLVEGGWLCLNVECRALYASGEIEINRPVIEGDASDECGYYACQSCMETLDERSQLMDWQQAPIPTPDHMIARARVLGLIA